MEKCTARGYHEAERRTNMQEKVGRARIIGYAIGIGVAILVALWRLIPR